ncbi:coiled-coil domain-containing protein [Mycobacteroides abscessus]|uniref:hypothetical protein n=1 Tax=Mycobacteroides abscessus TaxID=36809 RepID=UPI0009299A78|nr:hypothetical protein [Mycobacteroides abscessus]MBN7324435.1 hypothetical protein [Mycobacteroides abscessus subsp. massiliense]MBN7428705.1 hypothetical protein [Mycobacteroides abscessus subsp. massiliense]SHV73691.1 Uncharacterised protein [Mycobacteroides abscessus subsp. abscessus]SHW32393.1 Uncharacterised protein [Mycobacteroides abscessus subsp. abscessus]SHW39842.1 Uncharacterised protein [Mycobacteroides abscessus subsp. abscessus]
MSLAPGAPWPGASRGEVASPSGRRAYLANTVAVLCGRSPAWATNLARSVVESEKGRIPGRQGLDTWFLLADSLEHHLQEQGLWPSTGGQRVNLDSAPAEAVPDDRQMIALQGADLIALQGADLEASRQEVAELKETVEHLEMQRNQLLETVKEQAAVIATLTQLAKTPPRR